MGYGGYRGGYRGGYSRKSQTTRKRRYQGWGGRSSGPSKYSELTRIFGGAVDGIRAAFLDLNGDALDELLEDYGEIHGEAAESYARRAFPKWRSGETRLSGQTMERLVELVPPYLSPAQRFEVMRKVVEKHRPNAPFLSVHVDSKKPEEGFARIDAALERMRKEDLLAHVPENVLAASTWLCDNDMTAARALLAALEGRENELLRESAIREIELLKRTVRSGQVKHASYSVRMPGGNLNVSVHKRSACFVATACFGTHAPETETLRRWRDERLISSPSGRRFIAWYYAHGATLAKLARNTPGALPAIRWMLRHFARAVAGREASERKVR